MKLLAALIAVTLASPFALGQELEEAPGAAPMNTAPPPSSDELNEAVDQLSHEKSAPAPARPAPERKTTKEQPLKHGTAFAKKAVKKAAKKPVKAGKKLAGKAKGKKVKAKSKKR